MAASAEVTAFQSPFPRLLVVASADGTLQLLTGVLEGLACRLRKSHTVEGALACQQADPVDLVLFDEEMPLVPAMRRLPGRTPLLVALTQHSMPGMIANVDQPDAYLQQPLQGPVARARIEELLRLRESLDTLAEAEQLLLQVAETVERRVPNIGNHCRRMADGATQFGAALGCSSRELHLLQRGAYLHDIGKLHTPDSILFKPGLLTERERVVMEQHVLHGVEICRPVRTLSPVLPLIRHHHERWDGSGYPDRLVGKQIPFLARVLQIVDIFDSLTHARPYQPAIAIGTALEVLLTEARSGWRDPKLVTAFLKMQRPH